MRYSNLEKEATAIAEVCTMTRHHTYLASSTNIYITQENLLTKLQDTKPTKQPRLDKAFGVIRGIPNINFTPAADQKELGHSIQDNLDREILNFCHSNRKTSPTIDPQTTYIKKAELETWRNNSTFVLQKIKIVQEIDQTVDGRKHWKLQHITDTVPDLDEKKILSCTASRQITLDKAEIKRIHFRFGHPDVNSLFKLCRLFHKTKDVDLKIVDQVVKECSICKDTSTTKDKQDTATNQKFPDRPRQIISLRTFTPSKVTERKGYSVILCIVDEFSKYVTLFPCRTKHHNDIAEQLRTYLMIMGAEHLEEIRAREELRSNGIFKDMAKEFHFKWNYVAVDETSLEDTTLQTSIPELVQWVMEKLKIGNHHWSDAIHHAAHLANSMPNPHHGLPPELVHFGSITNGYFIDPSTHITPKMRKLWKDVRDKLVAARQVNLKGIGGPFKQVTLQPGDKVYAFLSGKTPVKAKVLEDFGNSIWIEKETGPHRFDKVLVHKSRIARRLEF